MFHKMLAITITLTLLIGKQVFAEGTIGASFSQIIDDRSLGITGDYTTPIGKRITFEADGRILSGNIHNITLNTDFTFDIATVDLKLLIENKVKGYTLDTLGREQSLGLAFTLPVESLNFDVGIGGKNASPFGSAQRLRYTRRERILGIRTDRQRT